MLPYAVSKVTQDLMGYQDDRSHDLHIVRARASDPARFRLSDVPVLGGSPEKIERVAGWRSQVPPEQTLTDLLDDWRRRLASPRV